MAEKVAQYLLIQLYEAGMENAQCTETQGKNHVLYVDPIVRYSIYRTQVNGFLQENVQLSLVDFYRL